MRPEDLDVLIYAGVCRELFEPATACRVAAGIGVGPDAAVYDVSNACLGVLNGMVDVANRIELGQVRAGMVVSCETAREINDIIIERMLASAVDGRLQELARDADRRLGGGRGASDRRVVLGEAAAAARRGDPDGAGVPRALPLGDRGDPPGRAAYHQFMATDSVAVLKHGVELGQRTWATFLRKLGWISDQIDKVICHQVGAGHRDTILKLLGIDAEKDFSTYPYLGNIGTVSLPLTAALAEDRDFLRPGDRVAFLGIGSGLNCLMLGLEW